MPKNPDHDRVRSMTIDPQLPGAEIVAQGIEELRAGKRSAEACLVASGRTRLRRLGVDVPSAEFIEGFPEHALYDVLTDELGQAAGYARYNALLALLHSFANALAVANRAETA